MRVILVTVGTLLLLTGVVLLVLPGPGLLLVLAGIVLLSRAIPALRRHVEPIRARALKTAEDSVSSRWRIAGSTLAGLALISSGVLWASVAALPFSGWGTGAGLILSGLILFALLLWSHHRLRTARPNDRRHAPEPPRRRP